MTEEAKKNKEEFLSLLRSTNREGIEDLISFLENSDFFTAPASTRFHGNVESGLLAHSLLVYKIVSEKMKHTPVEINTPDELGVWEKVPYYKVEDTIPYGHGEKSVMMITEYIKMTPEEKYAVRWHMGYTEPKELYTTIGLAYSKYPYALMLHEADIEATYLFDV